MPRETRARPVASTASRPLASLLAHSTTPNELLPHLHQHALDLTGGSCSLLFSPKPRTRGLQPTSRVGPRAPRAGPPRPGPTEEAAVTRPFDRRAPTPRVGPAPQAP